MLLAAFGCCLLLFAAVGCCWLLIGKLIAADVNEFDVLCFIFDGFVGYDSCDSLVGYPSFPPLLVQEAP